MERGAWQVTVHRTTKCWTHPTPWSAAVHGVTKSQTWLSDWTELKQLNMHPPHLFFSRSVMSDILQPHRLQHTMGSVVCSIFPRSLLKLMSFSWWCHPTVSSSVASFSSWSQSFPASGSLPVSQLFASGGQSIRTSVSVSVLPVNIQDWFPLGLTGLVSLQSEGLSRGAKVLVH